MKKKAITIYIGEYYASKNPAVIYTVVGSCVAVCLFDPIHKIGGMNHILLPGKADMINFDTPARYGINAMELLINKMMRLGCSRHHLIAKVFGGAHLFPAISRENGVGRKITDFVLDFLQNESIEMANYDLNGHESRRIFFHTDTGEVFLKRIKSRYYSDIVLKERKMLWRIQEESQRPAKITFFKNSNL